MDLRQLTPDLAVSPQIELEDLPALAKAGFRMIINNRPDGEIAPDLRDAEMQAAAEKLGMQYRYLPFEPGHVSPELIEGFAEATRQAKPALAYCRSGNRSTVLWALTQAGRRPLEEINESAAKAGYDLSPVQPLLQSLATRKG